MLCVLGALGGLDGLHDGDIIEELERFDDIDMPVTASALCDGCALSELRTGH